MAFKRCSGKHLPFAKTMIQNPKNWNSLYEKNVGTIRLQMCTLSQRSQPIFDFQSTTPFWSRRSRNGLEGIVMSNCDVRADRIVPPIHPYPPENTRNVTSQFLSLLTVGPWLFFGHPTSLNMEDDMPTCWIFSDRLYTNITKKTRYDLVCMCYSCVISHSWRRIKTVRMNICIYIHKYPTCVSYLQPATCYLTKAYLSETLTLERMSKVIVRQGLHLAKF